jgi:hypothetical protein
LSPNIRTIIIFPAAISKWEGSNQYSFFVTSHGGELESQMGTIWLIRSAKPSIISRFVQIQMFPDHRRYCYRKVNAVLTAKRNKILELRKLGGQIGPKGVPGAAECSEPNASMARCSGPTGGNGSSCTMSGFVREAWFTSSLELFPRSLNWNGTEYAFGVQENICSNGACEQQKGSGYYDV